MICSLPSRQQKAGAAPGENGFPLGSHFLRHLSPLPVCEEQVALLAGSTASEVAALPVLAESIPVPASNPT
ncbi:unnamed protein product [Pleuronectes platessa]|uniref:Uncharacterized protein n=1 Tax=Pleuronectes platessa TaxID=8262 RepID=A0A9N7Z540_PLEPL|nr:unnamed protein product [Pleuronectes platessa]